MKQIAFRLLVAAALFVTLSGLCLRDYIPPLSSPLTVDLVLEKGRPGQSDPLLVSGVVNAGDFLFLRYVDETHFTFGYDSWAMPGIPPSAPIAFTSGVPLRVSIELPMLGETHESLLEPPGRLRVTVPGQSVFESKVFYYKRYPEHIWIGENPLGGTACVSHLNGRVLRPDGRELRGPPAAFFSLHDRLRGWVHHSKQVFALVLLCGAVACGWIPFRWFTLTSISATTITVTRALAPHRWFVGTTTAVSVIFGWMITDGTFAFFRNEDFTSFYELQMGSILQGRLDVTDEAIGGEAFVVGGKLYGYFGPTPSFLRLPFVLFNIGFGQLSRSFMLAYLVASLVASYQLLRHALKLLGHTAPPTAFATLLLVTHIGLGSTLFFLSSRAYVYHEAIMCGVAFALWSGYFSLRHLSEPTARWWLWALLCGLLSLHARPPTGLYSLTLLGCVSVAHLLVLFRQRSSAATVRHLGIGALCVVGVLTFNGLSYLKFQTFDGAPLRFSRPYDPPRLAAIDGKSFHLSNLPFGFYTYLLRPNFRIEPSFPWLYLEARTAGIYFPKAKIDLPDSTNALPWSMPGLFLLSTLGCLAALRFAPALRSTVWVLWIAALPMSLALFAAVAIAQRYTGDFIPVLVGGSAVGLAVLETSVTRGRPVLRSGLALATLFAIVFTFAITLRYQREIVWGVPENFRQDFQTLRQRIDSVFKR